MITLNRFSNCKQIVTDFDNVVTLQQTVTNTVMYFNTSNNSHYTNKYPILNNIPPCVYIFFCVNVAVIPIIESWQLNIN